MENISDLRDVFKILRNHWKAILAIVVTAILLTMAVSIYLIKPVYQAEAQVIINQKNKNDSVYNPNEVQTNLQLINTYSQMINSGIVREKVINQLNLKISEGELQQNINVISSDTSQIIKIVVNANSSDDAAKIANSLAHVAQTEVERVMGVDNLSIFSEAKSDENINPIKPKPILYSIIAAFLSFFLGLLWLLLKELYNTKIDSEEKVETYLNLPTIGKISNIYK
ncbi:YveK family protein [Macrococcus bovicus]|uniref:YveK family protein n=1 Tax=Macrococcus bovicus TaxID=69968 RepID=UPI0025A64877|nr:Wzz/FepE/Etk N-terminal domain-containing protein [Macrococcus bovicus]WJP98483.1 Wzz/FepE/Etk N-terminal domain-containing protein [Macrococcus bovicus]